MPRARLTHTAVLDGVATDITTDVADVSLWRGSNPNRNPRRTVPGTDGTLTLANGNAQWTPGRSMVYTDSTLMMPIALTITIGATTWWTGQMVLESDDERKATATARLTTPAAELDTVADTTVTLNAGDTLAEAVSAIAAAVGLTITATLTDAEASQAVTAGTYTDTPAGWRNALQAAVPAVLVDKPDGGLALVSAAGATAVPPSLLIAHTTHWITHADIGPDTKRITNRYTGATADGATWSHADAMSVTTWGAKESKSAFPAYTAAPDEDIFGDALAAYGSPPVVAHLTIPLTQPTEAALADVVGSVTAGVALRLSLPRAFLQSALVLGVRLDDGTNVAPTLTAVVLAQAYEPKVFILGNNTDIATLLGSNAVLSAAGSANKQYWILNYDRLGQTTIL